MPCCCGGGCDCTSKQWVITLSGNSDYKPYGDGKKVAVADGECLNGSYVFPFEGGNILLCDTGEYLSGFELVPQDLSRRGEKVATYQRILRVATSGCSGSSFVLTVVIITNSKWSVNDPQPANWGSAEIGAIFSGWRYSSVLNCGNAISIQGKLDTSGTPFLLYSGGTGYPWLTPSFDANFNYLYGSMKIELQ